MTRICAFLAACIVVLLCPALAGAEDAASVAQKYAGLLRKADYKSAYQMLAPAAKATPQSEFEKLIRLHLSPKPGVTKVELGAPLFSQEARTAALVLFARTLAIDPKQLSDLRAKLESGRDEDFPAKQLPAAQKHIRFEGGSWKDHWPVYLVREIKYETKRTEDGEPIETIEVLGPWMIDPKGGGFPFREFRAGLIKKFGANLLRYAGEDSGDAGCYDPKNAEGRCYQDEDPAPTAGAKSQPKCILTDQGKPCGPEAECLYPGGDEPVPCKKGQSDCWTADGEACAIR